MYSLNSVVFKNQDPATSAQWSLPLSTSPGLTLLVLSVQRNEIKQNKLPKHHHCPLYTAHLYSSDGGFKSVWSVAHKVPATSGKMEIKLKCSFQKGVTPWTWFCVVFKMFLFMLAVIQTAGGYFTSYLDKKSHRYLLPEVDLARWAQRAVVWKCFWQLKVEGKEFPHPEVKDAEAALKELLQEQTRISLSELNCHLQSHL